MLQRFMKTQENYTPDLVCATDANNKGLLNNGVGLINYDEVVLAGGYPLQGNNSYYLSKNYYWWTQSPAGVYSNYAHVWYVNNDGSLNLSYVNIAIAARPVINLNAGVEATGTGTSSDPYVIE